ncbi:MAG: YbjN domain-containing protein [Alphaproteobacteria bacterium]|nr:YbjN domain-containing protein [Alphaproteobacteria bacterium]
MNNIIDIAEETFEKLDYNFSRVDENELAVSLPPNYSLSVFLKPEYDILHFSNDLDLICPDERLAVIEDSIIKANERIWLGHFDLISTDNRLVYSLSFPFAHSFLFDEDNFESLIDLICEESDRFYHYFKMLLSDKQIPNFSISTLFQESVGEA